MKRRAFVISLLPLVALTMLFAGCSLTELKLVTASGPVTTRDYNITDFTGVEAGGVFQVELVPASTYSVNVTSNENLFDYIEVTKSGDTLRLGLRNGVGFTGPMTLKARITMPELWSLRLSGASSATADGFGSTHDLRLNISGASRLDMDMETGDFSCDISGAGRAEGSLKAEDSNMRLSGAASLELDGSGANAAINASGASTANLDDFTVQDAGVTLSGGSRATVNATGKLDVNLSGGSTLQYSGNPTMGKVNVSGGSTLRQGPSS